MTIGIVLIAIVGVCYFNINSYRYNKDLRESKITAKVIGVEYHNRGGYRYFYDGSSFWGTTFSLDRDSAELIVGDSLSKTPGLLELKVYRKSNKKSYQYMRTYYGDID
ncbi:hypothetical protein [Sabulibacter ruber]|uniref:hypothetical protein n=1 Tax=Sabulibacter ruber TaxID=2811901 RepID=UPI001A96E7CB|nr:hypothetical protein [Sabulibacter ruber]